MDQLFTLEVAHNTLLQCHLNPTPDTAPQISQEPTTTPKPLTVDCLDALLQMQRNRPIL